jgi:hypothetical protein
MPCLPASWIKLDGSRYEGQGLSTVARSYRPKSNVMPSKALQRRSRRNPASCRLRNRIASRACFSIPPWERCHVQS